MGTLFCTSAFTLVALLAGTASSASAPEVFSVQVKMEAKGVTTLVPVGEITRTADGKVTVRGLAAPALDRLADDFAAEWKAYSLPESVTITDTIPSSTGMRPAGGNDARSMTFTPKDRLFPAAVIRQFVEKHGYNALGMSSVRFIEYDTSAENCHGCSDASQTNSNFRKGTELDLRSGYDAFYISAPVRSGGNGNPTGVLRVSATDPTLAVSTDWDDGTAEIAIMKVFPDGHITLEKTYAGPLFLRTFGTYIPADVDVPVIENATTYTSRPVVKSSPLALEAYLVENFEHRHHYRVTPLIDPARFGPAPAKP